MVLYAITAAISWLLIKLQIFRPPRMDVLYCGLFGFSGKRPADETKLRWLAVENQSRGTDSTGVWGNHLYKNKVRAKDFISDPGFKKAIKGSHLVIGHTRSATVGSVTSENAHPFAFLEDEAAGFPIKIPCVGAHNGWILSDLLDFYTKKFGFDKQFNVDSQLIFATLAKTGDVNILSQLEAAMAVTFTFPTLDLNTLYVYKREKTRPFHFGEAPDGLYYSSESDPLKYIGCRSVWAIEPNTLYTVKEGTIIDVLPMSGHVLKSLSANVQRNSWRSGVPIVEINALPKDANGQPIVSVTSNTIQATASHGYQHTMGFGPNYSSLGSRGGNQGTSKLIDYSTSEKEDSIESRFRIFMRNIELEIKNLTSSSIDPDVVRSKLVDDVGGCFLGISLRSKEKGIRLGGWTVMCEDNVELSGLTSINGMTMIKIPFSMCNKELSFSLYDPVDELGPYKVKLEPAAGRVMEVTLSIPFRQGGEKETGANNNNPVRSSENSSGGRSTRDNCEIPYTNGDGDSAAFRRSCKQLLLPSEIKVSGGSEEGKTDGSLHSKGDSTVVLQSSSLEDQCDDRSLILQRRNLIPTMVDKDHQRKLILSLTAQQNDGTYIFNLLPLKIYSWAISTEDYLTWREIYQTLFTKELKWYRLILEAARCMAYDRTEFKAWYKFHLYIEILLKVLPERYINAVETLTSSGATSNKEMYLPSAIMAALPSFSEKEKKKQ